MTDYIRRPRRTATECRNAENSKAILNYISEKVKSRLEELRWTPYYFYNFMTEVPHSTALAIIRGSRAYSITVLADVLNDLDLELKIVPKTKRSDETKD